MNKLLALLWLGACGAGIAWLLHDAQGLRHRIDTDLFALLPADGRDPVARAAMHAISGAAERSLVVVLGDEDPDRALGAAHLVRRELLEAPLTARPASALVGSVADFFATYRSSLLSRADHDRLAGPGGAQYFHDRALAAAYGPLTQGGLSWSKDPFGLYGNWLAERAAATHIRPYDDELSVQAGGITYVLVPYELRGSAVSLDLQASLTLHLSAARAAVERALPGVKFVSAGTVLYAANAAGAAQREMSIIGAGSTLGALLLVVVVFRGPRPAALVVLSLAVGTLAALLASFAVFSRVHVLTLVFGASLIGVAVDYSLLAFGASLGDSGEVAARYRRLRPALWLALLTTLVGYTALAVTPFPGLQQMAVFAAAGIGGAWLTVILWFPHLGAGEIAPSRASRWIASGIERWPLLRRRHWPIVAALAAVATVGLARLDIADDVRGLVRIDPALLEQQQAIAKVLEVPSPAQFYVLGARDEESVLVSMERLTAQLDALVANGRLDGYQAPSQWVPSLARQRENRERVGAVLESPGGPLSRLAIETGLDPAPLIAEARNAAFLTVPAWLASPASAPLRPLWLGSVTAGPNASAIVLLKGLNDPKTSRALAAIALPGVRYIDKPAQISALLRSEGARLTWLLVIAYALTALVLVRRYQARSWRVLVPTLAATVLTLALHGLIGAPVQMVTLISLFLLLGMGVDYGIFLAERPGDGRMFVSIGLSAVCTVLSFGLLAFSSTPALHAFGLATLAGTILVWLMAPTCRAPPMPKGQA